MKKFFMILILVSSVNVRVLGEIAKNKIQVLFEPEKVFIISDDKKKYGVCLENNELLTPISYDDIAIINRKLAFINYQGQWGVNNLTTKENIIKPIWKSICYVNDSLYKVNNNDKFGLINKDNKMIIPAEYSFIGVFYNGIAPIELGEEKGFCNVKGEIVLLSNQNEFIYDAKLSNEDYLILAALNNNPKIAEVLLGLGAKFHIRNSEDKSPFEIAILEGNIEVLEYFISNNYTEPDTRLKNFYRGIFFEATKKNATNTIEYLLNNGLNLNRENSNKNTLFQEILDENPNLEIVNILLSYEADINKPNVEGFTPLMIACKSDKNLEIIKELIKKGAKIEEKNNKGNTPYLIASEHSANRIKEYLISLGANTEVKNIKGKNAKKIEEKHKKEVRNENKIFNKNYVSVIINKDENELNIDLNYGKAMMPEKMDLYSNYDFVRYGLGVKRFANDDFIGYIEVGGGDIGLFPLQVSFDLGVSSTGRLYSGRKLIVGLLWFYAVIGDEIIGKSKNSYVSLGMSFVF